MRKYTVVLALILSTFNLQLSTIKACTNFLVGRQASADGSTIISYAADSYGMYGFLLPRHVLQEPDACHGPEDIAGRSVGG